MKDVVENEVLDEKNIRKSKKYLINQVIILLKKK